MNRPWWWRLLVPVVLVLFMSACEQTWAQYGHDGGLTGFNPDESTINAGNVAGLTEAFRVHLGGPGGLAQWSSPAVVGGVVYAVDDSNRLVAFDAHAGPSCSGAPLVCPPTWSGHQYFGGQPAGPAVSAGVVFVGETSGPSLVAYDAAGSTNCTGAPKVCEPIWTSSDTSGSWGSPKVANGLVYIVDRDRLVLKVYDAAGDRGCTGVPKTCAALWQGSVGPSYATVAIAGSTAFVLDRDGVLWAFDATGTGCTGATLPKTCLPKWTTAANGPTLSFPAVAGGTVFVTAGTTLSAFDAAGSTGCSGTPKVCTAMWTAGSGSAFSPGQGGPTVAYGTVFVGGSAGVQAYDVAGATSCSGSPKTCLPLWSAPSPTWSSIGVANGVVYFGSLATATGVTAFDAHGTAQCSGAPKVCTPLATLGAGSSSPAAGAILNGYVYVAASDGYLHAFH